MAKYTSNNKTLEWARKQGWLMWRVEQFNQFSGFKTDLLHIIDYLGITTNKTVGIQICGADFSEHFTKIFIEERENTRLWLSDPHRQLVLIGWRKVKMKRGGKAMVYKPRILWFTMHNGRLDYGQELSE